MPENAAGARPPRARRPREAWSRAAFRRPRSASGEREQGTEHNYMPSIILASVVSALMIGALVGVFWLAPRSTGPEGVADQAKPAVAEQAVALHAADQCPEGRFDLILDGSQLALQVHESIGHPIELDRVLGSEANYAGMSFLTLDKLNQLRYGSEIVNAVCDARLDHGPGLGTFAFDDEGVPAQCTDIIKDGQFRGYLSNRETAHLVGLARSSGTMRTESWNRLPIIRMTNISLKPASIIGLCQAQVTTYLTAARLIASFCFCREKANMIGSKTKQCRQMTNSASEPPFFLRQRHHWP